jgi:hypothetical protein
MGTRRKRSSAASEAPATRKKKIEELEPTTFCTFWPNNPVFDPNRILLRRLFFINEDRTKYVSVGFYPARDYLPLVEFGVARRDGGPKTLILCDEQVDEMAEALPMLRDAMCSGETSVGGRRCEICAFRLEGTRSRRTARLYVESQFISLTLQDIDYVSRMFIVVQQQLRDYIVAIEDVLPYATATLTSVTYVDASPDANKNINFPLLYEELIHFV